MNDQGKFAAPGEMALAELSPAATATCAVAERMDDAARAHAKIAAVCEREIQNRKSRWRSGRNVDGVLPVVFLHHGVRN